jgi:hypothetical protein
MNTLKLVCLTIIRVVKTGLVASPNCRECRQAKAAAGRFERT